MEGKVLRYARIVVGSEKYAVQTQKRGREARAVRQLPNTKQKRKGGRWCRKLEAAAKEKKRESMAIKGAACATPGMGGVRSQGACMSILLGNEDKKAFLGEPRKLLLGKSPTRELAGVSQRRGFCT